MFFNKKCLVEVISRLKTEVIKYHNSAYEVISMDDELPLVIFVITQLKSYDNLCIDLSMIEFYLTLCEDTDFEERKFTIFSVY